MAEQPVDPSVTGRRLNRLGMGAGAIGLLCYTVVEYFMTPALWGFFLPFRIGLGVLGLALVAADRFEKTSGAAAFHGFWIPVFLFLSLGAGRLPTPLSLLLWNIHLCAIVFFIAGTAVIPPRLAWVLPAVSGTGYLGAFLIAPAVSFPDMLVHGGLLYLAALAIMFPWLRLRHRQSTGDERRHREISAQNEALRASNAAKDRFFSIIAHDLKGPIGSAARVLTRMLEPGADPDRADLAVVGEAVNRSYSLLENLLLWARSQRGELNNIPVEINLGRLAGQIWEEFAGAAERNRIVLENGIHPEHGLVADKKAVAIIVRNLLSNAVRFSSEGGRVALSSEKRGDRVVLEVRDTGPGMDADTVRRLFQIDEKQLTTTPDGARGTGVGLILSKELAEKNSGALGVVSVPGEGSSFFLELPSA